MRQFSFVARKDEAVSLFLSIGLNSLSSLQLIHVDNQGIETVVPNIVKQQTEDGVEITIPSSYIEPSTLEGSFRVDADNKQMAMLEGSMIYDLNATTGIKGQTGDKGPQGDQGIKGISGDVGPQGPQGIAGPDGNKGLAGDQGPIGDQGQRGVEGPQGGQGPLGPSGPAGPTGDKGPTGSTGQAGPTGDKGPTGSTGNQGPIGERGPQGLQGLPGVQGAVGSVGDKGPTGEKGSVGDQGPKGPTGDKGPVGDKGLTGDTGTAAGIYTQVTVKAGDTINAATGTNEQTFASQASIAANTLSIGDTIIVRGYGLFTTTALGPSQRPRVRLGGTVVIDAGNLALLGSVTNARYDFECRFVVRAIGTAGKIECVGRLHFVSSLATGESMTFLAGPTAGGVENANPVTINTTIANTLALSTQYSVALTGNSNTLRQFQAIVSKVTGATS